MPAITTLLNATAELLAGTYTWDGRVPFAPYTFQRSTSTASETLPNNGNGAPVKGGTGMVRSAFRPSDDACIFQLFVPANMMFSRYLSLCADIMDKINLGLAQGMRIYAGKIRAGIEKIRQGASPRIRKDICLRGGWVRGALRYGRWARLLPF